MKYRIYFRIRCYRDYLHGPHTWGWRRYCPGVAA